MTFHFKSAEQDTDALNVAIMLGGGSGCGKTYSALQLAKGLAGGEPFAVIDTENRRAMHHRRAFPMMHHLDLQPDPETGFSPDVYMAALDAAEAEGYPVIVVDSFSHVWEGIGGVLEMQARALDRLTRGDPAKRESMSMLAWAEVKPKARRLVDRIIRAKAHVILCARAKKMITDRQGKLVRENKIRRSDVPWDLAVDKDIIFETTMTFMLVPERPGVPLPIKMADEFKAAIPLNRAISPEAGARLAEWSRQTDWQDDKALYDRARAASRKGTEEGKAFWFSLKDAEKIALRPILEELGRLAVAADQAAEVAVDPFSAAAAAAQEADGGDWGSEPPEHRMDEERAEQIAREARERSNAMAEGAR